jgi:hypothetical protein
MIKSIDSPAGEGEIAIMSILTKVASLRADDAMTIDEAAELANMVTLCRQTQKMFCLLHLILNRKA